MPSKYILAWDPDEDGYIIVKHISNTAMGAYYEYIDDTVYKDVVEAAKELKQLENILGEIEADRGRMQ